MGIWPLLQGGWALRGAGRSGGLGPPGVKAGHSGGLGAPEGRRETLTSGSQAPFREHAGGRAAMPPLLFRKLFHQRPQGHRAGQRGHLNTSQPQPKGPTTWGFARERAPDRSLCASEELWPGWRGLKTRMWTWLLSGREHPHSPPPWGCRPCSPAPCRAPSRLCGILPTWGWGVGQKSGAQGHRAETGLGSSSPNITMVVSPGLWGGAGAPRNVSLPSTPFPSVIT